jgi:hypothetical protein
VDRGRAAHAVVEVDGHVPAVGPALERDEAGEEQLLPWRGGNEAAQVQGRRPEVAVASEPAARPPHLELVLPPGARVAPGVPRVPPQRHAHPEEGVVVVRKYEALTFPRPWSPNHRIGFFVESPELLHAAGLAERDDRLQLALERPDGTLLTREVRAAADPPEGEPLALLDRSRVVDFAAENASPVPLALAEPRRFFRALPLPGLDAFYVQLRKNAPAHLRFDGGGDLTTTRAFFERLPRLVPGRIFALASSRTFSAGLASLGYLKQAGGERVTIVGEPVGDRLEFRAEGSLLDLPDSGAVLLYATDRHDYRTGCPEADCHDPIRRHPIRVASLDPDVPAPLTFAAYRAGRDPAMEAVREALASFSRAGPSTPGRP